MSRPKKEGHTAGQNGVEESRADKFRRLANRRVNAAIKRMRQIASLGNSRAYEYTPEQAANVCTVLKREMQRIEKAFSGEKLVEEAFEL